MLIRRRKIEQFNTELHNIHARTKQQSIHHSPQIIKQGYTEAVDGDVNGKWNANVKIAAIYNTSSCAGGWLAVL